jgi:hypothetical protein
LSNGKLGLPPSSEALIRTKTIIGVHVLIGYGAIATHMPYLTSRSSHCRSMVRILAKKRPSGRITTLVSIKQEMVRKQ